MKLILGLSIPEQSKFTGSQTYVAIEVAYRYDYTDITRCNHGQGKTFSLPKIRTLVLDFRTCSILNSIKSILRMKGGNQFYVAIEVAYRYDYTDITRCNHGQESIFGLPKIRALALDFHNSHILDSN